MWDILQDNSSNLCCKSMHVYKKEAVVDHCSQPEIILSSEGHLTMSGDSFDCHNLRTATGIWGAEAEDAAKHPKIHRMAPQELPPRYQQCHC